MQLFKELKFCKLSNLLSASVNLRVIPHSKAVTPTHIFFTRYPHPKSIPSGKGTYFRPLGLHKRYFALAKLKLKKMLLQVNSPGP